MPAHEITLRPATPDEIDAVLAFWRESAYGVSPTDDAESLVSLLARDRDALLLAVAGDRIVGSIIAGWDGWRGNLYRLAVLPEYRRQGIGTQLVTGAEDRIRRLGGRRVGAIVERDNDRARQFWAAHGYAATALQDRYFKDLS